MAESTRRRVLRKLIRSMSRVITAEAPRASTSTSTWTQLTR